MQCGKRKHLSWQDPVGEMLKSLNEPRPWYNKVVAIANNVKFFELHFILNRAILLKWKAEIIMNWLKIMGIELEHLVFMDSVSYLPCLLRRLPVAYFLTASKSWYPHYFNIEGNLDYIVPIPGVKYYDVNEMGEEERREFLAWYESQKSEIFDNRCVLEKYCQDNSTVQRQACLVFRRESMQIWNLDVFILSITIALVCKTFCVNNSCSPPLSDSYLQGGKRSITIIVRRL